MNSRRLPAGSAVTTATLAMKTTRMAAMLRGPSASLCCLDAFAASDSLYARSTRLPQPLPPRHLSLPDPYPTGKIDPLCG